METIHVVTATNDRYAKHLAVMLTSLLINKSSKNPIIIYVIGNLTTINIEKLKNAVKRFDAEIKIMKVVDANFNQFRVNKHMHISKETYYRIAIPDLLDANINKALYLDCDMIIREDITKLWNTNLGNYYVAAVQIPGIVTRYEDLAIPPTHGYFNAGVLLINLKKWREGRISQRVIRFIRNNPQKLRFMDQDALNAVLHNKWLKLDLTWNFQVHRCYKLQMNPAIIHYTTNAKPWNSKPRFKGEYDKYLRLTNWTT